MTVSQQSKEVTSLLHIFFFENPLPSSKSFASVEISDPRDDERSTNIDVIAFYYPGQETEHFLQSRLRWLSGGTL